MMSLILDALRKMELERKAKRQNAPALRTEVINYRGTAPQPVRPRLVPITALLVIVAALIGGLMVYKGSAPAPQQSPAPQQASIPAPPVIQAVIPPPTAPPVSAPPRPAQQTAPAAPPNAPVSEKRGSARRALPEVSPPPAGFSVSGIAWQDEHALRRAVVNGSLVGEGAEIAGARVVEIRENLVRFSQGGKIFEIGYPSGPGK